jgi:hypothetical protein
VVEYFFLITHGNIGNSFIVLDQDMSDRWLQKKYAFQGTSHMAGSSWIRNKNIWIEVILIPLEKKQSRYQEAYHLSLDTSFCKTGFHNVPFYHSRCIKIYVWLVKMLQVQCLGPRSLVSFVYSPDKNSSQNNCSLVNHRYCSIACMIGNFFLWCS